MQQNDHLLISYFNQHEEEMLADYFTCLEFQSISSESEFEEEMVACVSWLQEKISQLNFSTELWETSGHPTLFAENLDAGPKKPTLLIYNHYDVQPVDPLELWNTPPFKPTKIGNDIFARGAQDNKGQLQYVFQAIKALITIYGTLPLNIKWVIEGEEECGSEGLSRILSQKKEALKADYLAVPDLGILSANTPSVTLGIRGITTMDLEIIGSNTDLHSGTHGGRAYNPLHALVEILGKLRNKEGEIVVPGFYEEVIELSDEERQKIDFSFSPDEYFSTFALKATGGEISFTPMERSTIRPTLEINGLTGGYTGDGFKTVIPAVAKAKLSCRLVPGQSPEAVGQKVKKHIESLSPEGMKTKVTLHEGGGEAVCSSLESAAVQAFAKAYSEVFNKKCSFIFEGGSIPIITELSNASSAEVVLLGMGLDSDQIHAPNEHFGWDRFKKGFLVFAKGISLLAQH